MLDTLDPPVITTLACMMCHDILSTHGRNLQTVSAFIHLQTCIIEETGLAF